LPDARPAAAEAAPPSLDVAETVRVLHVFPDFVAAGPELRAVALIEAFGPALEHAVESLGGRSDAAGSLAPGSAVTVLPPSPRAGSLRTARRLRGLLARRRPDLVLTYNWAAVDMLFAARTAGFRSLVHHEDGFDRDEARRLKLRRVWARRLALPVARRVVVPSRSLERIARQRWRVPASRLVRIPNGVRAERFAAAEGNPELRRELGIAPGEGVVGAVGHLRPEKAIERLIAALRELDGAHLVVVGDGAELPRLEATARAAGLAARCHFVGHRPDPRPWYRTFDVFALASDTEQLPMALLEAMASSLPVVATSVGDVPQALPPEQGGLLVPPGESAAAAMAAHLRELLSQPARRRRLGQSNRRRVEAEYSFARMAGAYEDVYRAALPGPAAERWPRRRAAC
jgi:glycosyltransferase involved in cell wall biosynthesis